MFNPLENLFALFNLFIGIVDTTLSAMLLPLFSIFGLAPPSLVSLLNSLG